MAAPKFARELREATGSSAKANLVAAIGAGIAFLVIRAFERATK